MDTIHLNATVTGMTRNRSTTTGKLTAKFTVFTAIALTSRHVFGHLRNDILNGLCFCPLPRRNRWYMGSGRRSNYVRHLCTTKQREAYADVYFVIVEVAKENIRLRDKPPRTILRGDGNCFFRKLLILQLGGNYYNQNIR